MKHINKAVLFPREMGRNAVQDTLGFVFLGVTFLKVAGRIFLYFFITSFMSVEHTHAISPTMLDFIVKKKKVMI